MSGNAPHLWVGQRVEINNLGPGNITYMGEPHFAPGTWVGIVLDMPNGKNDGSVQGRVYIENCPPRHGVFVRPSQVHVLPQPGPTLSSVADGDSLDGSLSPIPTSDPDEPPPARAPPSRAPAAPSAATPRMTVRTAAARTPATAPRTTPAAAARARAAASAAASPTATRAAAPGARARPSVAARSAATTPGSSRPTPPSSRQSPMRRGSLGAGAAGARLRSSVTPGSSARPTPGASTRPSPSPATSRASSAAGPAAPAARAAAAASRPSTAPRPGLRSTPAARSAPAPTTATAARTRLSAAAAPARRPGAAVATPVARRPAPPPAAAPAAAAAAPAAAPAAAAPSSATTPSRTGSLRSTVPSARPALLTASTPASRRQALEIRELQAQFGLSSDPADEGSDELMLPPSYDEPSSLEFEPHADNGQAETRAGFLAQVSPASFQEEEDDGRELAVSPSARMGGAPPLATSTRTMTGSPVKQGAAVSSREVTDLRKKVTVLERQKEDDRERLRELERYKEDADKFLSQKGKMMERMQDLEQDVRNYEKMEKEWMAQRDQMELDTQDMSEQLEMSTLDKEVAEEQVELLKEQLEQEKLRADELQIDLEVLQEQQQAALDRLHEEEASSPMATGAEGPGDGARGASEMRAAATIAQLERQNEKLKEALVRFRDITNEVDSEQRRKISEMDKELAHLNNIQAQYEQASERLDSAENLIEELKVQLDDALNAEEMLEELTERNLVLNEKVEEMKSVIEDLEALKELNDELEETHIETEKQLQEEIDLKDIELAEQHHRNETLEINVAEDQAIFAQFREVTIQLQSEIERLQEEKAQWIANAEGDEASALAAVGGNGKLASQTQAMLNLNMKLQTSILKSQAKTIELELGKLAAQQAQQQIDIIRPYLPAPFFHEDADAVSALLFFERIRQKADIIKNVIEIHYDIPRQLERSETTVAGSPPPNETLISICQMRRHLAHFTAVSRQISAIVGHGSTGAFIRGGRMYKELAPVERRIDMYIDALRKEELKESECVSDLMRFITQLEDFAEALAGADQEAVAEGGMVIEPDAEPDLSAKEVGSVSLFEHDLDTLFASLAFTRQVIAALHVDGSVEWELGGGGKSVDNAMFGPLDELVDKLKAAKVTSHKFLRHLEGLHANTEALRMDAVSSTLPTLTQTSSELVEFAAALARSASAYAHEVKTTKMPCLLSNFLKQVLDSTKEGFNVFDAEPWTKPLESTSSMVTTVSSLLTAAKEPDNIVKLVGAEPWLARVEQVRVESMRNVEAERTVARLTDEIRDLYRELKWRDERVQEDGIKVERLNRQLKASREQAEQIVSLKHELGETLKQSRAYQEANDALQTEIDDLEKNLVVARKQVNAAAVATEGSPEGAPGAEKPAPTEFTYSSIDVETSYLLDRVRALQAALRHVVNENAYLKSADLRGALFTLPALPLDEAEAHEAVKEDEEKEAEVLPLEKAEGELDLPSLLFQAKTIRKQALEFASTPRMLDITCTSFKPPRSHRKHKKHGHRHSRGRSLTSLPEAMSSEKPSEPAEDNENDKEKTEPPKPSASAGPAPLKRWSPASSVPTKLLTERQHTAARFSAKIRAIQGQLEARTAATSSQPSRRTGALIPLMAPLAATAVA